MFCNGLETLDPGFHRDDGKRPFSAFYETITLRYLRVNGRGGSCSSDVARGEACHEVSGYRTMNGMQGELFRES